MAELLSALSSKAAVRFHGSAGLDAACASRNSASLANGRESSACLGEGFLGAVEVVEAAPDVADLGHGQRRPERDGPSSSLARRASRFVVDHSASFDDLRAMELAEPGARGERRVRG